MSFAGFPTVALWNADRSSDFICIEPWFGHTDFEKVDGPFEKREGTLSLKPGDTFNAQYTIESADVSSLHTQNNQKEYKKSARICPGGFFIGWVWRQYRAGKSRTLFFILLEIGTT